MQGEFYESRDEDSASLHFMKRQEKMANCYASFALQIEGKLMGPWPKSTSWF